MATREAPLPSTSWWKVSPSALRSRILGFDRKMAMEWGWFTHHRRFGDSPMKPRNMFLFTVEQQLSCTFNHDYDLMGEALMGIVMEINYQRQMSWRIHAVADGNIPIHLLEGFRCPFCLDHNGMHDHIPYTMFWPWQSGTWVLPWI